MIPGSAVVGQLPVTQKLGVSQVILEGIFILQNTTVQVPTAGVMGSVFIRFQAPHAVASDGSITIIIPTGTPNSDTTGFVLYNVGVGAGGSGLSGSLSLSGPTNHAVVITGFTGIPQTAVLVELTNIRSHANRASESWQVITKDSAGNIIDEDITTLIATPDKNLLTSVKLGCDASLGTSVCVLSTQGVPNAGVESTITFNFTTTGNVPAVGMLRFYFPEGFILGNVSAQSVVGMASNITTVVESSTNYSQRVVVVSGFSEIASGSKSVTLTNIRSHSNKLSETFMLETTDNFGNIFDEVRSNLTFTPAQGNLTNVTFACDASAGPEICGYEKIDTVSGNDTITTYIYNTVPNAGVKSSVTVTIQTTGRIDANGKLQLTFPAGFLLESPALLSTTLPGQVILNISGQVITLSGFDSAILPSIQSFTVSNIRSHAAKLSGVFTINTTDSVGNIYDQLTGPQFTPIRGNITNVTITIPNSGVIGVVKVSFNTAGQVPSTGRINVTVPHDYALGMYNHASGKLEFFATVSNPSGVLSGAVQIESIDEVTNSAIIVGFNTIEPGFLEFALNYVKPGAGAAGTFRIQTTDSDSITIDDTRYGDEAGQATSSAGIAPVTGSLGDVELTAPTAGAKSSFNVVMTTIGEVEDTGKIMLYFPIGFEIVDVSVSNAAGRLWLSQNTVASANTTAVSCNISTNCGGGMVSVSGFARIAPGTLSFQLDGIRSPGAGTYTFLVETGDISGFVIDQRTTQVVVTPSIMSGVHIAIQNAGIEGNVTIEFTTLAYTPQDGSVVLGFPTKTKFGLPSPFVFGEITIVSLLGLLSGLTPTLTVSNENVVLSGMPPLVPGKMGIVLNNIRSPASVETSPFALRTLDANGLTLNENPSLLSVTPAKGKLSSVNLAFAAPGTLGTMNVSFATEGTLVSDGKVKIKFPEVFELPYISIEAHSPGGTLAATTDLQVQTDRVARVVSVTVLGGIPRGLLSFQLYPISIPVGFGSATFVIETAEPGAPDRVVDEVDYQLVNTVGVRFRWDQELLSTSSDQEVRRYSVDHVVTRA